MKRDVPMSRLDDRRLDAAFRLIEAAAVAGDRCPQNKPFGPLRDGAIRGLIAAGRVRSEVYLHNWRVVTLLAGPHKGKATAAPPQGGRPYLVNGVRVGRLGR